MNKQLFLAANVAQNTKSTAALLAAGEVGVFGINAVTGQTEKVSLSATYNRFWLGVGRAGGKEPWISRTFVGPFTRQQFQYDKFLYTPAVGQTILVSTTCSGNSEYDTFILRIATRFGFGLSGEEKDNKSFAVSGVFATQRALYDAWAERINGDPAKSYNAVGTDAGVQITAMDPLQVMNVSAEYWDNPSRPECRTCYNCDVVVEQMNAVSTGSGTAEDLKSYAYDADAYYNDRLMTNPGADLDSAVAAFGNADLIHIRWKNIDQAKGDSGQVFDMYQQVTLGFPTGTDTGSLETVLNYLLGTTIRVPVAA